jgi:hypothetical protein
MLRPRASILSVIGDGRRVVGALGCCVVLAACSGARLGEVFVESAAVESRAAPTLARTADGAALRGVRARADKGVKLVDEGRSARIVQASEERTRALSEAELDALEEESAVESRAKPAEPRPVEPTRSAPAPTFKLGLLFGTPTDSLEIWDAQRGVIGLSESGELKPLIEEATDSLTIDLAAAVEAKCKGCYAGPRRAKAVHEALAEEAQAQRLVRDISLGLDGVKVEFMVMARTVTLKLGWPTLITTVDNIIATARHLCPGKQLQPNVRREDTDSRICAKWRQVRPRGDEAARLP